MTLPLAGVRVLDLTRLLPGPVATQHLADLGAEVLKIEDPDAGDYARRFGLADDDPRTSPFFSVVQRGKALRTLDLKSAAGRDALLALIDDSDVLIESFRPGVMQRLGLGYDTLHARNPRLVVCAITGYGQHGPLAHAAGHDLNYLATAGALPAFATPGGEPVLPNLQVADLMGGALMAVMGVLAALVAARSTGQGRLVDVSMTDGVLLHNLLQLYAHNLTGHSKPAGQDLLNGGVPCYGLYRCADGLWLAVGALELKFWQAVCDVLERPDWKHAHWSLGQAPGSSAAQALRHEVQQRFAGAPRAHWLQRFEGVDACVSAAASFEDALAHPQFAARQVVRHGHAGGFDLTWFDLAASLFGETGRAPGAAPPPGDAAA